MYQYTVLAAGQPHEDERVNRTRAHLGREAAEVVVGARDGVPCEILDFAGARARLGEALLPAPATLADAAAALEAHANEGLTRHIELPAQLLADVLPAVARTRLTLSVPEAATAEQVADAQCELLDAVGVEPEYGDRLPWRAGAYYAQGTTILHTDGEAYMVHQDHVSSWGYIPGTPTGRAYYTPQGDTPPQEELLPWTIGRSYVAGQLILHTDGETYRVAVDHTASWAAVPGGNDPTGIYVRV